MKFPRFSRHDRFWLWYVLIIFGIYLIGALIWRTAGPQTATNSIDLALALIDLV